MESCRREGQDFQPIKEVQRQEEEEEVPYILFFNNSVQSTPLPVHHIKTNYIRSSEYLRLHKSIVRSAVKKIVCSDRIIALKLKAEPVNILIMQVYMPTSENEDDEVEKLYDTIVKILEEDGKGDTNNIILGHWNSVVGDEPYWDNVGSH